MTTEYACNDVAHFLLKFAFLAHLCRFIDADFCQLSQHPPDRELWL